MRKLIIVWMFVLLTACSSFTVNTLSVVTSATNLHWYYENGEVINFIDQAKLSDIEIAQVIEAMDQIDRSKEKLLVYKENPITIISNINSITLQYVKIKGSYITVRSIVEKHWSEYPESSKQVFNTFDAYALNLDKNFDSLIKSIDANAALNTAIALASTGLKLAAIL